MDDPLAAQFTVVQGGSRGFKVHDPVPAEVSSVEGEVLLMNQRLQGSLGWGGGAAADVVAVVVSGWKTIQP